MLETPALVNQEVVSKSVEPHSILGPMLGSTLPTFLFLLTL